MQKGTGSIIRIITGLRKMVCVTWYHLTAMRSAGHSLNYVTIRS